MVGVCLLPAWGADSALQFRKIFGGSGNDSVKAIATDPSGYVIVGGSTSSYDFPVTDGSRNSATQFGVSVDSGGSWQPLGNLPQGTPVTLAAGTSAWYAGGSGGIFKSTDGGATWTLSLGGAAAALVVMDPSRESTVYAIFDGSIVKTVDAGLTWAPTGSAMRSDSMAVDPFFPDHIFTLKVGTGSFRSFDGGQSWTQYSTRAPHPEDQCQSGVAPFAFDRVTPGVAYMADHCNLFRSTDAGVSWSIVATPFELTFGAMATTKSGALYVVGEDGLYRSGDQGSTWTRLLASGFAAGPRLVTVDPARSPVIVTDTMRSADGGITWAPLALGRLANAVVFDPAHSGRVVAATAGASSGFLAKLDSAGTILAATYLGGQGGAGIAGVAAGADGRIYVTGSTASRDYPVTAGAWITGPPAGGYNYFVAAFDADLKPVYGTYLRTGIGYMGGIAVDGSGSAVVAGAGPGAAGAQWKCFAIKLISDGSGVRFDRAFGGSNDICTSVAADGAGNSIVVGTASSGDFPVTGGSALTQWQGDRDAIVAKLDADGNLVFSGYLGGAGADQAWSAATDGAGNVYIAGNTGSKDFPVTSGAYQPSLSSKCPYPSSSVITGLIGTITEYYTDDVFLTKLDPGGNLIYSTYLGGGCYDVPTSMAVDRQGNVWVTGTTNSDPFPQVNAFESGPRTTYYKAFVSELDASGGSLRLSSYLTAGTQPVIAVDGFGDAYVGGSTVPPQSPYGGLP
ncbi:MAG TPA: SBBP repeat-containing protein, partial [Candidatus Solibacter sp.]